MRTHQIPRIVVCGAVDDGKSTLIGRLLAETGSIPQDELSSATSADGVLDFSRLTDGLESERSQGITIDVAYRYLALPNGNRALLADSPGHEQYTRNMAVAASTATVALLVVDSVRGVREQTLRHALVCSLMGVRSFVIALNKIDALNTGEQASRLRELTTQISESLNAHATALSSTNHTETADTFISVVPVSGLHGDNVVTPRPDQLDLGSRSTTLIGALSEAIEHAAETLKNATPPHLNRGERRWA